MKTILSITVASGCRRRPRGATSAGIVLPPTCWFSTARSTPAAERHIRAGRCRAGKHDRGGRDDAGRSDGFAGRRRKWSTRAARAVLPGFNDVHTHMLSGGLAMENVELGGAGDARRGAAADSHVRVRARRPSLDSRTRLEVRAVSREPADARTTRRGGSRSTGGDAVLRRPQHLGELEGARPRRASRRARPTRPTAPSSAIRGPESRPGC